MELENKLEVAKTGRAKCRGCKQLIGQGELRFGEEVESIYGDGDTATMWYHVLCAAKKRPSQLRTELASFQGKIPGRAEIEKALSEGAAPKASGSRKAGAKAGADKPATYPYAETAPTARSKCMECEQVIAKDSLRIAVEREVEIAGAMRLGPGYLHPGCAAKHTGDKQLAEQLKANSKLPAKELAALVKQLRSES